MKSIKNMIDPKGIMNPGSESISFRPLRARLMEFAELYPD
jgi:hypothetical protein